MKYLRILSEANSHSKYSYGYTPYLLGAATALLYPFTWMYCNEANLSLAENTLVRGLACSTIHYATCTLTASPTDLPDPPSLRRLLLRSCIMTVYSIVISLAQFMLPLPVVHTINNSGVLFVFLIDYLVNEVRISRTQALGIVVGLLGVFVVGNAGFIMELIDQDYQSKSEFKNYLTNDHRVIAGFMALFVVMMFCWAYGVVLTKSIKANTYQINFVMGLVIHFTGAVMLPFTSNRVPHSKLVMAFFLTGIPITFTQTTYIAALTMSKNSGMVSITGFLAVFVSYFISIFRYHEKPNIVTSLGVCFVLFGVWRTIYAKK